jgi:hypothetical protein
MCELLTKDDGAQVGIVSLTDGIDENRLRFKRASGSAEKQNPAKEQLGMAEQWRDIARYDGVYQVSDQGQVRNTQTSKLLQPVKIKNGRLYVSLSSEGFQRKCTVHSLVTSAFLGDCPLGHEITHKDGSDYTHNELSNLEYVTRRENQKRFVMRSGGYSVNLTKRVQTPEGLRYCPVVESANGRVKPDFVIVNGQPERHPEGRTTWNGERTAGACACRSAKTPPMPLLAASAKKPN